MEKTVRLFSVLYFVLIILGYINLYSYYSYFDIEIHNYLTVTEIALSFTSILATLIVVSFTRMLGMLIILSRNKISKNSEMSDELIDGWKRIRQAYKIFCYKRIRKRFSIKTKIGVIVQALFNNFTISISVVSYFAYTAIYNYILGGKTFLEIGEFSLYITLLFTYTYISDFLYKFIAKIYRNLVGEFNNQYAYAILTCFIVIVFVLSYNAVKSKKILLGYPLYRVTIKTDTETIKTSREIIYIGSTNQYVFLRNLNQKENIIINTNNIRKIKKKKLRNGKL